MTDFDPPPVRTFHARNGRMSSRRVSELAALLERFGADRLCVDHDGLVDTAGAGAGGILHSDRPLVLDVGCGHGESTIGYAEAHPDHDVIGIDIHKPGLLTLLRNLDAGAAPNAFALRGDAVSLLETRIAPESLEAVLLFFPDPWPKRAQQKRRFIRPDLLDLVASRLRPLGVLCTATDDPGYAGQIEQLLGRHRSFDLLGGTRPEWRPDTLYERKALAAGRTVKEFTARRSPSRG